jgi:hypothetical protein
VVRGHHTTLYDIELPYWLPIPALQSMINVYEWKVWDEFLQITGVEESAKNCKTHQRTPSSQSNAPSASTGISVDPETVLDEILDAESS